MGEKMADEKFFWFPLHAGDFLSKTAAYTPGQIGCFILLRCYLARHDALPSSLGALRQICKQAPATDVRLCLNLFERDASGRLFCPLIARQKNYAVEAAAKKSAAGKAGAVKRWGNDNRRRGTV